MDTHLITHCTMKWKIQCAVTFSIYHMKIQVDEEEESLPQESKRRDAMEKKKLSKAQAQALEMAPNQNNTKQH